MGIIYTRIFRQIKVLEAYKYKTGNSVISTHISPEGACNLSCPYCSVSKREKHSRIDIKKIKDYIIKLKSRGLQAVILTGGGEPTLYPNFNQLVEWIKIQQGLSIALITNGTLITTIPQDILDMFSWIRVSYNNFPNWKEKIKFPKIQGTLGVSMVYTGQTINELKEIAEFIPKEHVTYVRVLPNCLLEQEMLLFEHKKLEKILLELSDKRFFQQFKIHNQPCSNICHQAYFRPYLSELGGGTVFPCDSLVLNDEIKKFDKRYAICDSSKILDFLDHKISLTFDAKELCTGCVFAKNIKLLDDYYKYNIQYFNETQKRVRHAEFV